MMACRNAFLPFVVLCLGFSATAPLGFCQQSEASAPQASSSEGKTQTEAAAPQASSAPQASNSGGKTLIPKGSNVYIDPMDGFETHLTAALTKKQVPVVVVIDKAQAQYEIKGATQEKKHSAKAKITAMVLAGGMGAAATADHLTGSIQIVDLHTSAVVYAYTATKDDRPQSVAEACAKHIKNEAVVH